MFEGQIWLWIGFNLFVLLMLALDLGVFHRKAHAVSTKEALTWSVVWITLSLVFSAVIYLFWDKMMPGSDLANKEATLAYLTGYLIEKALSVDNIFVFILIFSFFAVPAVYQHRVLFWGILGALVMRGSMILVGAALIEKFHWIIYIFGAFLVYTGIRMASHQDEEVQPDKNPVVKFFRRFMPVTENFEGDKFFVRRAGKILATPLFLILLIIESTDLVFAVDSIPAIFAVTHDPFIVYSSNIFAILGLRALYFLLANVMGQFQYLKLGLSAVLTFVGIKMVVADIYHISVGASLGVVAGLLALSIFASLWKTRTPAGELSTGD
ncbi:MAG TPA: TerC family protein [Anaerolineales bacterium]|nr:TerC family protein [Anaerolineales bacterium]